MSVVFPPEFVRRIADVYGEESEVALRARGGDIFAGRLMDDSSQGGMSPELVRDMIDVGQADELRMKAIQLIRKKALYHEFLYRYRREQFPNEPDQWGDLPLGVEL
jgi:hypothetical protein